MAVVIVLGGFPFSEMRERLRGLMGWTVHPDVPPGFSHLPVPHCLWYIRNTSQLTKWGSSEWLKQAIKYDKNFRIFSSYLIIITNIEFMTCVEINLVA